MLATLTPYLTIAAYVISGAVVALTAIAPLTKTDWDNKFLAGLVWFHDNVLAKVLPLHDVSPKQPPTPTDTTPAAA